MSVEVGLSMQHGFVVDSTLATTLDGALPAPVLATASMIREMERAATACLHPHLPNGQVTVGFEVHVRHLAPARLGTACLAEAVLSRIADGRKFVFDVQVTAEEDHQTRVIGVGTHERRLKRDDREFRGADPS